MVGHWGNRLQEQYLPQVWFGVHEGIDDVILLLLYVVERLMERGGFKQDDYRDGFFTLCIYSFLRLSKSKAKLLRPHYSSLLVISAMRSMVTRVFTIDHLRPLLIPLQ